MSFLRRLSPRDSTFYDLFARQAEHLVTGATLLSELPSTTNRPGLAERMKQAEHECDDATHEIVRTVNSTFVTPFDREDIFALASALDDVMDFMEEAVDAVSLLQLDELPDELSEQIDVLQRMAALTAEAMPRLRSMKDLREYWIEINRLENNGDQIHRQVLHHLFDGTSDSLTVLKVKTVVDLLEDAVDAFEKVAHVIEQIAVKES